ncbi:LD-carboxypeptidase [Hyphococcus flavus]|uniref:LD-carboxypeptidase n=1 Tax=Hyphococcus flavus TaxID=1866326 RepID=A0AAE9ZDC1_9PROT|nr:LD-carboxypeptidase [Hyphococcus flavus]WDI32446.1 LD-carboxypeptidase [Hyphococcus flavus]
MSETTKHIALCCPGGPIARDLAEKTARIAAARFGDRMKLYFHDQCFLEAGHFAGSDAERSAAFIEVANNAEFDAVWFARGGYGACRLDDALFAKLNEHARAKTFLGYSDAGSLLARLYKEGIGNPVHGPMPTDLPRQGGEEAIARALSFLADGDRSALEPNVKSDSKFAAFNITILAHLVGTQWMPDLSDHVIMLEDVSEYLYRLDRAMFSIMGDQGVKRARGIMLGRVSDIPENDRPFGKTEEEIIKDWCARANIPYIGRADIGHDADNKIVPFGGTNIA